jgi:hypothetical protein
VTPSLLLLILPATPGYVAMSIFSSALVASGTPGRSSLRPLVSLGLATTLDFVLIPRYGASGAAAAASIEYLAGGAAAKSSSIAAGQHSPGDTPAPPSPATWTSFALLRGRSSGARPRGPEAHDAERAAEAALSWASEGWCAYLTEKKLVVNVQFPLSSIAWISSSYSTPDWRKTAGMGTLLAEAGSSTW